MPRYTLQNISQNLQNIKVLTRYLFESLSGFLYVNTLIMVKKHNNS